MNVPSVFIVAVNVVLVESTAFTAVTLVVSIAPSILVVNVLYDGATTQFTEVWFDPEPVEPSVTLTVTFLGFISSLDGT